MLIMLSRPVAWRRSKELQGYVTGGRCCQKVCWGISTISYLFRMTRVPICIFDQQLRAKQQKACPFTPIHITGKRMAIADFPSRSFGSNPAWHCNSDDELLSLFNSTFPLPSQQSWMIFYLNCRTVMRMISTLRMKPFVLDDWRRLPSPGKLVGNIGKPTSHLWDSIRTYNRQILNNEFAASQDSPSALAQVTMDEDDRYRLQQLQELLRLGRWYPWLSDTIQQRS